MRRVVVTGLGIVSSIGNNRDEVVAALKAGTSGIVASPEMAERGFRSQVAGTLKIDPAAHVDKRTLRFMGPGAAYAHIAMAEAIADAIEAPSPISYLEIPGFPEPSVDGHAGRLILGHLAGIPVACLQGRGYTVR